MADAAGTSAAGFADPDTLTFRYGMRSQGVDQPTGKSKSLIPDNRCAIACKNSIPADDDGAVFSESLHHQHTVEGVAGPVWQVLSRSAWARFSGRIVPRDGKAILTAVFRVQIQRRN